MEKKLSELVMFESMSINFFSGGGTDVVKVPGGLLYRTWYLGSSGASIHTIFVPEQLKDRWIDA